MRNLIQPPPSMHCELCDGELRFKRIEPDDPAFDMEVEIFVCSKCGHVHSLPVIHDPYAAHTARSMAIAESLKQLRSKIVSARNAPPGRGANRDLSMGGTASYDDEQDEAQKTPYSPHDRDERSTFSLHISC